MKCRVQKWGNSLALRIPKSFAADARLSENTPVELSLDNGMLTIKAMAEVPQTLDELLRGVTRKNLHAEWDMGPAVGKEIW